MFKGMLLGVVFYLVDKEYSNDSKSDIFIFLN